MIRLRHIAINMKELVLSHTGLRFAPPLRGASAYYFFFLALILSSCTSFQSYEGVLEQEMARGVRYDSLFYGLYFNMPSEQFFEHGFNMNRQGIFFQYSGQQKIKIEYPDEFSYPVEFVFYPLFEKDVIRGLEGYYSYTAWNGFNKAYFAENLQLELVKKLEEWYGGRSFLKLTDPSSLSGDVYVKIDGNRQISLSNSFDHHRVEILFTDLSADTTIKARL